MLHSDIADAGSSSQDNAPSGKLSFMANYKYQVIILLIIAVGLNMNTLFNQYAMDDMIVLTDNTLVQKGINGIPEIITKDWFYGVSKHDVAISGGRYRPFSLIIFAIEHQFFGDNPFISHLINVLLFALLMVLLFKLMREHIFKEHHPQLAFITCLLFVVHPIHTEVIANVKSRDELITFILLILASFSLIEYASKKSIGILLTGLLCFFLALLTRESAVPFIGVTPLVAYFFFHQSAKKSLLIAIPLLLVFVIYLALRIAVVGVSHVTGPDILNFPFLYASPSEAFATKVYVLLKYLSLLVFPYPLSCDYSYNQVPYIQLVSFRFILSAIVILSLIIYAFILFRKRSLFSFCIFYFAMTIFLFSNFVIDIGAPLAERILFQPSLAFCIILAFLYLQANRNSGKLTSTILIIVLLLFSFETVTRNSDWKNNETLYSADVKTSPNSVRTNMYAAAQYLLKARNELNSSLKNNYFEKAAYYDARAVKMYPHYQPLLLDLGAAYFGMFDYYKAADPWIEAFKLDSQNPDVKKRVENLSDLLYNEGNRYYRAGKIDSAILNYNKSVELNDHNVDAWYNMGGSYFLLDDTKHGIEAWQNVLRLSPNHPLNRDRFLKIESR